MNIKAIFYECEDIGTAIKSSSRRFFWRFSVDGKEHSVELIVSYFSGKRRVSHNGTEIYEGQNLMLATFQYPFSVDGCNLNIIQHGEKYELRINNNVFEHLYAQEKMKSEFTYDPSWNQDREEEEDKPEINSNDRFEYEKSKYGGSEFSGTDTDYHRRKPIFDDPPKKKTEVQFKSSTLQTVKPNDFSNFSDWGTAGKADFKQQGSASKQTYDFSNFSNTNTATPTKQFQQTSANLLELDDGLSQPKQQFSTNTYGSISKNPASNFDEFFGGSDTKKPSFPANILQESNTTNSNKKEAQFDDFFNAPSSLPKTSTAQQGSNTKANNFDDFFNAQPQQPKIETVQQKKQVIADPFAAFENSTTTTTSKVKDPKAEFDNFDFGNSTKPVQQKNVDPFSTFETFGSWGPTTNSKSNTAQGQPDLAAIDFGGNKAKITEQPKKPVVKEPEKPKPKESWPSHLVNLDRLDDDLGIPLGGGKNMGFGTNNPVTSTSSWNTQQSTQSTKEITSIDQIDTIKTPFDLF